MGQETGDGAQDDGWVSSDPAALAQEAERVAGRLKLTTPDGKPLGQLDFEPPKQFARPDGTYDWKALASSYVELRKKLSQKTEDLKAQILAELDSEREAALKEPEKVYTLELPEGVLPEGVELTLDESDKPFVDEIRRVFAKHGVPSSAWQQILASYAKWSASKLPNVEEEAKKLGPDYPDRARAIDNWLRANLPTDHYAQLRRFAVTADAFRAIEALVNRIAQSDASSAAHAAPPSSPLDTFDIQAAMSNPDYWKQNQHGELLRELVYQTLKRRGG